MELDNNSVKFIRRTIKRIILISYTGVLVGLFYIIIEKRISNIAALVAIILAIITLNIKMLDEL